MRNRFRIGEFMGEVLRIEKETGKWSGLFTLQKLYCTENEMRGCSGNASKLKRKAGALHFRDVRYA